MATIGTIGAGEVGSQIARAACGMRHAARGTRHAARGTRHAARGTRHAARVNGYKVVIANSRGPETLENLIAELGPSARAARAADAAEADDFAVVAVPLPRLSRHSLIFRPPASPPLVAPLAPPTGWRYRPQAISLKPLSS
ncbi:NAD(P)-binding domain-containing protein [Streptomyces scopuliridis]|uniref:NAD(P)-binding domain-containing protein n=1 Tax=Streptomyces scopuliridis TaxID=452529 RepID=UPI00367895CD